MSAKNINVVEIIGYHAGKKIRLPYFLSRIPAGFPSPADDFLEKKLDLNEFLIKHPSATFFVRVKGDSMVNAGINSGDILIVDRSLEPKDNKIVVAVLNGEFTVKRIKKKRDKLYLVPENPDFTPLEVTESMGFEIWGVVTNVIRSF
ncbi:MAG: translesion error-prone DNA polymerase V autoproteolytic subunit [Candidatus Omnitrophica bacterium]|nr:translesion error-prone DNA polymerase V autoproteolytic subunit [Candidatus Omnitrophota bacterium]